jgi:hypothetical protein
MYCITLSSLHHSCYRMPIKRVILKAYGPTVEGKDRLKDSDERLFEGDTEEVVRKNVDIDVTAIAVQRRSSAREDSKVSKVLSVPPRGKRESVNSLVKRRATVTGNYACAVEESVILVSNQSAAFNDSGSDVSETDTKLIASTGEQFKTHNIDWSGDERAGGGGRMMASSTMTIKKCQQQRHNVITASIPIKLFSIEF